MIAPGDASAVASSKQLGATRLNRWIMQSIKILLGLSIIFLFCSPAILVAVAGDRYALEHIRGWFFLLFTLALVGSLIVALDPRLLFQLFGRDCAPLGPLHISTSVILLANMGVQFFMIAR